MKTFFAVVAVVAVLMQSQVVSADTVFEPSDRFWAELRQLVVNCAVQPYTMKRGKKVFNRMRSTCGDLKVDGNHAYFVLDNASYQAEIVESPLSDGGDLYILTIQNTRGTVVALRDSVPAFGDVLLALAGSHQGIREEASLAR